ncbi:hypothetical protein C8R43DRAFT_966269, partial [Mycena crocata]
IKLESGLLEKTAELEAAAKRIQNSEAALKSAEVRIPEISQRLIGSNDRPADKVGVRVARKTAELEAAAKRIQDSEAALQSAEVRIAEISERTKSEADQSKSRLTELGNDKTKLESELLDKSAELEAAAKKIQDSEAALKSAEIKLESGLLEKTAELEAAAKRIQDSEAALQSAEARIAEISERTKSEADQSKSRLTELGNDKTKLESELLDKSAELEAAAKKIQDSEAALKSAEIKLESGLLEKTAELEAAAKRIQDSEAALKSAEIKLESGLLEKTAELEAAAKRIQNSEAALKSAEIKLESGLLEKTAELEAAAKRIQDSEAALQSAEVRIAEISERTKSEADQSAKSRLTELGNDKTRLESELLNKTAELEAAVKKIQDSEAALKSAETKLDSELLETSAELEAAVKQAQDAEAALKSAEIRIAEILEAVESKEARIEILQSEKTRLESEILSQKSELQAVTIKSQKFEEAVKAKEEHIQILGQEASDDKLEADWLQESIDAKTEKLHMARKKNYQLLELLNTHERRIWDLEQQISRDAVTAEEREFMISELQETASELQTQQSQLESEAKTRMSKMPQEVDENMVYIARLEAKLEALQLNHDALNAATFQIREQSEQAEQALGNEITSLEAQNLALLSEASSEGNKSFQNYIIIICVVVCKISDLKRRLGKVHDHISKIEQYCDNLKAEHHSLQMEYDILENRLIQTRDRLESRAQVLLNNSDALEYKMESLKKRYIDNMDSLKRAKIQSSEDNVLCLVFSVIEYSQRS